LARAARLARWSTAAVAVAGSLALAGPAAAAPKKPVEGGHQSNNTSLSGAIAVATQGTIAWTAAYNTGQLTAVDFANPASPTISGTTAGATIGSNTNTLENATNVTIPPGSNYAYVVSKNRNVGTSSNDDGNGDSLTIVNISNPSSPSVVGAVDDPSTTNSSLFGAYGVAVSGNYAYVASQGLLPHSQGNPQSPQTSTGSFDVINVNTPSNPQIVTSATLYNNSLPGQWAGSNALDHATSVAISGNYAYVTAANQDDLTVINISTPTSPKIVAVLHDATNLDFDVDVTIQGNYAYVANQIDSPSPSLAVVDISNPLNPHVVGTLVSTWLAGAYRIRTLGNFAYVAAHDGNNAAVVDISNPSNPVLATGINDPAYFSNTTGVAVDATGHSMLVTTPDVSNAGNLIGAITPLTLDPLANSVSIAPSSEPLNPTSQTTASFSFTSTDAVSSTSCSLDGGAYSPCTSHTTQAYTGLGSGSHTFTVRSTDAAGNASYDQYSWVVSPNASAPVKPSNRTRPKIRGTALQGRTLTLSAGTWSGSPAPTFSYQWEDCNSHGSSCTPIPGANATSYKLQGPDVGSTIRVAIAGFNPAGSATAKSGHTAAVQPPAGQVKALLRRSLLPSGGQSSIRALLKLGSYASTLTPLWGGRAQIRWYYLPHGAVLPGTRGRGHGHRPAAVLIAAGTAKLKQGRTVKLKVKLTRSGRAMLAGSRSLKLTALGTVTPTGGHASAFTRKFSLAFGRGARGLG
jgi:hypothetical protein